MIRQSRLRLSDVTDFVASRLAIRAIRLEIGASHGKSIAGLSLVVIALKAKRIAIHHQTYPMFDQEPPRMPELLALSDPP